MRYFMSIIPPVDLKQEDIAPGLMDAMGPWIERRLVDGSLISTAGLTPAENARLLRGSTGQIVITDGPFAETKEWIGGYAVLEASDLHSAEAIAGEFMQMHIDNGLDSVVLEVREIMGGANY